MGDCSLTQCIPDKASTRGKKEKTLYITRQLDHWSSQKPSLPIWACECVLYLGGEEGPAVGGGAGAACAVAVVRHRPLVAGRGTARCKI